jgi:DNA helicase HerA-like ATPase
VRSWNLDAAPYYVRLAPALVAIIILSYVIPGDKARSLALFSGVMGLLIIAIVQAHARGLLVLESKREGGEWEACYEIEAGGQEVLDSLLSFLEERSRSVRSSYLIAHHVIGGIRRTIIAIRGPRGEDKLLESVVSSLFRSGLIMRRMRRCEEATINPTTRISPGIPIGYDLSRALPERVHLTHADIEGHVGVFGSTGTGKSTTLSTIAKRAPQAWRVLVLDWTGEHAPLLREAGFTALDPRGGDLGIDIISCFDRGERQLVLEILTRALDLTEPQAYLLGRTLEEATSLPLALERLSGMPEESKWDREVKRALQRKLHTLLASAPAAFRECKPESLLLGRVVVDLSRIPETYSRKALANLILSILFVASRRPDFKRTIVIVDEAHNLIRENSRDIFNMVLAESRKHGLHLVYATQSPSLVGQLALLNTNTRIVHALKSQRDKRLIIDAMGLDEEWMQKLDKLPRGRALLQSPSHPQPKLVSIEPGDPEG